MTLDSAAGSPESSVFSLPPPRLHSDFSVERALYVRRSIREYRSDALTLAEFSQLLWAAQGITSPEGFRTAPSAGAVFPLETYAAIQSVAGLKDGFYHYLPGLTGHKLELLKEGRFGESLFDLSTKQDFIKQVPVNILLGTVTARMVEKYGEAMAPRYVHMEMGHAAQNLHLQAEALDLGSVAVGYLNESAVQDLFVLGNVEPLYMVSIGRKA